MVDPNPRCLSPTLTTTLRATVVVFHAFNEEDFTGVTNSLRVNNRFIQFQFLSNPEISSFATIHQGLCSAETWTLKCILTLTMAIPERVYGEDCLMLCRWLMLGMVLYEL